MSGHKNDTIMQQYIAALSEKELKAYNIAKTHLKSSFSLEKSKGFIEWKQKMEMDENKTTTILR
jgi:hypothetical protein